MKELKVEREVCARLPNHRGEFELCLYSNSLDEKEHLALVLGRVRAEEDVLVRVHSECFTGDVFGSSRCDCGEQLHEALKRIAEAGRGVVIYLRQEGRGIGLLEKLRAYNLQDEGYDTVEANLLLGHHADERDYTIAACILRDLGVRSVRLMTHNPDKIERLTELGVPISSRVQLKSTVTPHNARYLRTKIQRMNHLLELGPLALELIDSQNGTH